MISIDVSQALETLAAAQKGGFKEVNVRVSKDFQRRARHEAPIRTGRLIRRIGAGSTKYKAKINSRAPYSRFQEYGTKYHSAQPYMRPSLKNERIIKYEDWYQHRLAELL